MKKGSEAEFGEGSHVFPIWKDRLSAETIVSTPNSDVGMKMALALRHGDKLPVNHPLRRL